MNEEAKTEWIHVRVTKDLKSRILKHDQSVSKFVTDAIFQKLAKMEA